MKRLLVLLVLLNLLITPVNAMDYTAPIAPEDAQKYMPEDTASFSEGLLYIIQQALLELMPGLRDGCGVCLSIIAATMLLSFLKNIAAGTKDVVMLAGAVIVGLLFFGSVESMLQLGRNTIAQMSDYGKLLFPVLAAALAAQGGVGTSSALYAGTLFFGSVLSSVVSVLIVPMIYIYVALCIGQSFTANSGLSAARQFVKWLITWSLKITLYILTGYLGITGVISGTVDASAVKATKIALSGGVPVVGGILSDASETVLISAGIMKNSVGIYGMFALLGVCIGPFVRIAAQYLLMKLTAGICASFGENRLCALVKDLSSAMGFILAMTGSVCIVLIISITCFMKGMSG